MMLPVIGDTITNQKAIYLAQIYDLNYISDRITNNPTKYKNWVFDGVSGINDKLFAKLIGADNVNILYKCALPHDLAYAYGDILNEEERMHVDEIFYQNLLDENVSKIKAKIIHGIVRIFGARKLPFSFTWGFAYNEKNTFSPIIID